MSVADNGIVTKGVAFTSGPFEEEGSRPYTRTRLLVKQLDSSAKLLRELNTGTSECVGFAYGCYDLTITEVKTDGAGNIYVLTAISSSAATDINHTTFTLYKYGKTGQAAS